jgi:hypothetical protein
MFMCAVREQHSYMQSRGKLSLCLPSMVNSIETEETSLEFICKYTCTTYVLHFEHILYISLNLYNNIE